MKKLILMATAVAAVSANAAVTIYDSNGFEAPTFTGSAAGTNLSGQDGWTGAAAGTTNGRVFAGANLGVSPFAGNQMVRIQATNAGSSRFAWRDISAGVSSALLSPSTAAIRMSTKFNLGATTVSGISGILAYDLTGSDLIAGLYADTDGNIILDAGDGINGLVFSGFTEGVWHDLEMTLDYNLGIFSARIDGFYLGGYALTNTVADFDFYTQADAAGSVNGYFDDFKVTGVPEPGTMLAIGAGLAAMARRRRK